MGLYLLLNIALNSTWSRNKVAAVLERKTGMEWLIGTLHVLPNGTICVYDIESLVYEGGLHVEKVSADLRFGPLLDREIEIKELEIVRPSIDLTEKDLIAILHVQSQNVELPKPPEVAMEEQAQSEQAEVEVLASHGTNGMSPTKSSVEPVPTDKKIEVKPSGDLVVPEAVAVEDEREAWVRVVDGSFRLSKGGEEVTSLENFQAEIPIGGKLLTGEVSWGEIVVAGRRIVDRGEFLVSKENHALSVKQTDVSFFGLDLKPELLLVKGGRSGLLFQIDLEVPEQSAMELMTHLNLTVGMAVESVFGRMRMVGDLGHPLSWQALADVRAKNVEVAEGHRGGHYRFDSFQFQSILQRGVMQVPRLELLGEEVSVMSNGVATMNGYGFGVCRVVASGEKTAWINKLQGGAQMVQGVRGGLMRPLETNDVYYMDVEVDGSLLNPMMRVANVSEWQPLWEVVQGLRTFIKNERVEDLTTSQR
ncbi:hypothetical protein ACFSQZ_07925 [Rubritalea spongiae]|uniref:AsmA-like C-terminal domain-containing protein n=1 Tax=Rubritalea spongiae TaxID=430797 RepID=A0ABW5E556_9BACT